MKPTINRKTVIYFDTKQSRESAIDFLLKLNVKFTYFQALPLIKVSPSVFIKHHLDLYLPNIIATKSEFNYRRQYLQSP